MADDGWTHKDHLTIQAELLVLIPDNARIAAEEWRSISDLAKEANQFLAKARNNIQDGNDFWTGEGPRAAFETLDSVYKKTVEPPEIAQEISDGLHTDARLLSRARQVAMDNPPITMDGPMAIMGSAMAQVEEQLRLDKIRHEAQHYYSDALHRPRASMLQQLDGNEPRYPGGGPVQPGGTGTGGGGQSPADASKLASSLADKSTKPAFSDGAGNQNGQGAGSPSAGSGGGLPSGSGGSGGGLGSALSGLGAGSDKAGAGLAPGATTAAGYQPTSGSASGAGTLGSPGALRGGAGIPGPGAGGSGTGPAGTGGAGIRGGAMGMGMAPMAGAHGRGGKGEDDDEHETPAFMIHYDNTDEFFGDLPAASPGVIGDWSEQEKAEKQRLEREKRRYKSLGWNVDFGD